MTASSDHGPELTRAGFLARAGALAAGRWIQDGLQTGLLIWLARTDQSGYGLFIFAMGVANMVRAALAMGLDQYAVREFGRDKEGRVGLLTQLAWLKAALGLVITAGLILYAWLTGWTTAQGLVVVLIASARVLSALGDTFFSLYRIEGRQVREGAYGAAANLIAAVIGAAVVALGLGATGLALFVITAAALRLAFAAAGAKRLGLLSGLRRTLRRLEPIPADRWAALATIAGISLLGGFFNNIQIFLLKHFFAYDTVAVYGAAYDASGTITGLASQLIIGAILFPALARAAGRGDRALAEAAATHLRRLLVYGVGLGLGLSTLGGKILALVYGPKYLPSIEPLTILGPAVAASFAVNFGQAAMLALAAERTLLLFLLAPLVLSLGLGWLIIPDLGPSGAAWNLLACRIALAGLVMIWLNRRLSFLSWPVLGPTLLALTAFGLVYSSLARFWPIPAAVLGLGAYFLVAWRRGSL